MTDPKRTRKEQAEETKALLFNTALKLLDEEPFETITIRKIVQRAGVSIGTFYNYYATKLDVYYETYIFADDYFEHTVRDELQKIPSALERLMRFFDEYARYSCEITNLKLTRILYNSANKCFDRESVIGMRPLLTDILRKGQADGIFRSDRTPEEQAAFLMICVRGQVYHWCTNDGSYDLRQAVAGQVRMLLDTLLNTTQSKEVTEHVE